MSTNWETRSNWHFRLSPRRRRLFLKTAFRGRDLQARSGTKHLPQACAERGAEIFPLRCHLREALLIFTLLS